MSVVPTQCHTFLLMNRSLNRYLSHNRVLLEVWGAVPSCWNHCSSRVMVLRRPSAAQNFPSTTRCTGHSVFMTVTDCPFSSSNQPNGPVMPCFEMATHAVYESPYVGKQPPDNWQLEDSNYSQDQRNPHRGMCSCHWQLRAPLATVPATPWGSFGTHFGENIKVGLYDLQTGSFVEWPCTNWSYCAPNMQYFAETK